jgi:molybdenum cofactor guanylyltransferase
VDRVAAFILAGGKSSRMGQDKAFLTFEAETLLSRALSLAKAVSSQVSIVGDSRKFASFGPVVEDIYRECGPLGGIHAALSSAGAADLNLMLAVDLPFLPARFLEYLVAEAQKSSSLVTVPQTAAGFQPLCAVYRREFRDLAEEGLQNGRNKIDLLFATAELRIISEEEIVRKGFSREIFRNLNTPEDLNAALEKIKR